MAGSAIKAAQLGMPYGTAMNRLRKIIMFDLLFRYDENICFRCGQAIASPDDLSVEHKIPWLHSENPSELFWSLDNLAFSHLICNAGARRYATPLRGQASRRNGRQPKRRQTHGSLV